MNPSPAAKMLLVLSLGATLRLYGQDGNFTLPVPEIERRLRHEPLEIFRFRNSRFEGDITKRVILKWRDGSFMQVKWKRAPAGGWGTNNEPRYEIAAYKLQQLFLDPENYVVPPTVARTLPLDQYHAIDKAGEPTFKNSSSVLFVLQYWLENVTADDVFDKKRFNSDSTYARHLSNMNVLSHLIDHKDANIGNFLKSTDPKNPRVYAVDNSLAFASPESNRGFEWRKLRVNRLPKQTVERLQHIDLEMLRQSLDVVAQLEIRDGLLMVVEATAAIDPDQGVRQEENVVQFGLTAFEIKNVNERLQKLLKMVQSNKIKIF